MKIAFFEATQLEKQYVRKNIKNVKVDFFDKPLNDTTVSLAKGYDVISVFIYSRITKDVLKLLPKLKFIAARSTGFDHIDIKECNKKKILVANVPSYGENT
ncbi:MAG: hydroxyacid dehydrogenase, partial [Nanoarchaeota archaeon]